MLKSILFFFTLSVFFINCSITYGSCSKCTGEKCICPENKAQKIRKPHKYLSSDDIEHKVYLAMMKPQSYQELATLLIRLQYHLYQFEINNSGTKLIDQLLTLTSDELVGIQSFFQQAANRSGYIFHDFVVSEVEKEYPVTTSESIESGSNSSRIQYGDYTKFVFRCEL